MSFRSAVVGGCFFACDRNEFRRDVKTTFSTLFRFMNSDLIQPQRHRKSLLRTPRAGVWLLFSLLAGTSAGFAADAASAPDAFAQNQRLGRGVNILGYDPIWRSREQARFQVKHFRLLHEAGFDSVRINLHPFRHTSRERDWKLPDDWFATVDWAVTNALGNGLAVILDLHEFNAMAAGIRKGATTSFSPPGNNWRSTINPPRTACCSRS